MDGTYCQTKYSPKTGDAYTSEMWFSCKNHSNVRFWEKHDVYIEEYNEQGKVIAGAYIEDRHT